MNGKIVKGKGYVGIQCTIDQFKEMSHKEICGRERLDPYCEDECHHSHRSEHRGQLVCLDCSAVYDDNTMCWVGE